MNSTNFYLLSFINRGIKKVFYVFFISLLILTSCKQQKNITKKNSKCNLDYKNPKTLNANLKANELFFKSLNAKIAVESNIDSSFNSFSVSLRIKKDSIIWMSVSKLGIEGIRILITKDSVKFINRSNSNYFMGDFNYLSTLLNIQLDFEILQSLLVGNSVTFYTEEEKLKAGIDNCKYMLATIRKNKLRKVMEKGKELKEPIQSIYMMPETFKISRILFYEFNPERIFDAQYYNFLEIDSTQKFPTEMSFLIKAQKNAAINIKYSKIKLNEEQSFPFKIPENYEQFTYKKK